MDQQVHENRMGSQRWVCKSESKIITLSVSVLSRLLNFKFKLKTTFNNKLQPTQLATDTQTFISEELNHHDHCAWSFSTYWSYKHSNSIWLFEEHYLLGSLFVSVPVWFWCWPRTIGIATSFHWVGELQFICDTDRTKERKKKVRFPIELLVSCWAREIQECKQRHETMKETSTKF